MSDSIPYSGLKGRNKLTYGPALLRRNAYVDRQLDFPVSRRGTRGNVHVSEVSSAVTRRGRRWSLRHGREN